MQVRDKYHHSYIGITVPLDVSFFGDNVRVHYFFQSKKTILFSEGTMTIYALWLTLQLRRSTSRSLL